MEQYKQEFIEFMVDCKVLKFGDFVTKSGRKTPFFINTGFYRTGAQLKKLGEYYAEAINNKYGTDFDTNRYNDRLLATFQWHYLYEYSYKFSSLSLTFRCNILFCGNN